MIDPVIIANNIRKKYEDIDAVNGISFEVRRGEVFGMLGPNGAGKTTTIEILEGMRSADSGEAIIDGINVKKDPTSVKSIIGVQLQQNAFFDNLKLSEIVGMYAQLYETKVDSVEVLSRVGLEGRKNSKYAQLSGGQKQRLSIAVALVNDPVILFLDEPMSGLDPIGRRDIREILHRLKKQGKTVFFNSHLLPDVNEVCDRIGIMNQGKLIAEEEIANISRGDSYKDLEDYFLEKIETSAEDNDAEG